MEMEVSTCGIIAHPHTDNDLHDCQWIRPSDKFDWYPSKKSFVISLMEEKYITISSVYRCIDVVDIRIPSAPPTIQCIDDLGLMIFIEKRNFSHCTIPRLDAVPFSLYTRDELRVNTFA